MENGQLDKRPGCAAITTAPMVVAKKRPRIRKPIRTAASADITPTSTGRRKMKVRKISAIEQAEAPLAVKKNVKKRPIHTAASADTTPTSTSKKKYRVRAFSAVENAHASCTAFTKRKIKKRCVRNGANNTATAAADALFMDNPMNAPAFYESSNAMPHAESCNEFGLMFNTPVFATPENGETAALAPASIGKKLLRKLNATSPVFDIGPIRTPGFGYVGNVDAATEAASKSFGKLSIKTPELKIPPDAAVDPMIQGQPFMIPENAAAAAATAAWMANKKKSGLFEKLAFGPDDDFGFPPPITPNIVMGNKIDGVGLALGQKPDELELQQLIGKVNKPPVQQTPRSTLIQPPAAPSIAGRLLKKPAAVAETTPLNPSMESALLFKKKMFG